MKKIVKRKLVVDKIHIDADTGKMKGAKGRMVNVDVYDLDKEKYDVFDELGIRRMDR